MQKKLSLWLLGVIVALGIAAASVANFSPATAQIVTAYLLRTNNGSDILNTATFRTNLGAAKNGAITGSGLTVTSARLLGRTTASTGAIEEITVGSGLTLSGGNLSASGSSGTVTSVAETVPTSIMSISGSPITTSGTLAISLATQSANLVWAGPSTGSAATPTFRSLVAADIPALGAATATSVTFPAFSGNSGSVSSNTLGGYEDGTWTPVLVSWTNTGTVTVTGIYVRTGRQVCVWLRVSSTGTISSTVSISSVTGLPYTATIETAMSTANTSAGGGIAAGALISTSTIYPGTIPSTSLPVIFSGCYLH